jgi:protein-tyrosine phosphatase
MPASTYRLLAVALAATSCSEPSLVALSESTGQGSLRESARPNVADGDADVDTPASGGNGSTGAAGAGNRAGAASMAAAGTSGAVAGAATGPEPVTPHGCEPHQPVLTNAVTNARELGGTPLADGSVVACGALYRGQPLRLSETICADAARLGMRTVLDLRMESERLSSPDAACLDADLVFAPLPVPYGLSAADYLNVLHTTPSIATAFHTFGNPAAYPIYFHCTLGRDRTGIVGALLLLALGATRDTVMQEYRLSEPNVGASPNSLNAVLDEVEQRGGIENVLRDVGITDAELAVMRQNAISGALD